MTGLALVHDATWGGDAMPDGVQISSDGYGTLYSTRERAEARAARIRGNVAELVADLVAAWCEHDDEALGFGTFGEYTEWLFGDVRRVSIPVEARRELVAGMTERDGLSVRKIADYLGVSKSIVALDRKVMLADEQLVDARVLDVEPGDEVVDGEVITPLDPMRGFTPKWQSLALVAAAGAAGLTSLELVELLEAAHDTAHASLSKLAAKRLIVIGALTEARANRRPYRITDAGRVKLAELLAARDAND